MNINAKEIAEATMMTLAPFMPYLVEMSKASGEKLAEMIAEKGGETAWKKAQDLWNKLKTCFSQDTELNSAAKLVAIEPEDETRQAMLVELLRTRLQDDPMLAQKIIELLGGRDTVQQVLADRSSWVESVRQRVKSRGTQIVQASDESVIIDVEQITK